MGCPYFTYSTRAPQICHDCQCVWPWGMIQPHFIDILFSRLPWRLRGVREQISVLNNEKYKKVSLEVTGKLLLLNKGRMKEGNITGNTSRLSFLIWMWIVFGGVAAILWPCNKSKDEKFAGWSWQEGWLQNWVLGTRVESVLVNSASSCRRGFSAHPSSRAQW